MASSSGSGRVDDQQVVVEFMGLTGATKEVAEFHLEAAAGRLDVAVEAFYGAGVWARRRRRSFIFHSWLVSEMCVCVWWWVVTSGR